MFARLIAMSSLFPVAGCGPFLLLLGRGALTFSSRLGYAAAQVCPKTSFPQPSAFSREKSSSESPTRSASAASVSRSTR